MLKGWSPCPICFGQKYYLDLQANIVISNYPLTSSGLFFDPKYAQIITEKAKYIFVFLLGPERQNIAWKFPFSKKLKLSKKTSDQEFKKISLNTATICSKKHKKKGIFSV